MLTTIILGLVLGSLLVAVILWAIKQASKPIEPLTPVSQDVPWETTKLTIKTREVVTQKDVDAVKKPRKTATRKPRKKKE